MRNAWKAVYLHARARMLIKVVDWRLVHMRERERERERESNQIIGMTKKIAILFRRVVII